MPLRPQRPCRSTGCNALHRNSNGYCDAHADLAKAWATRQGSGRGGRPWRRLRDKVLARDKYLCRCEECTRLGRLREANEVDHVIPLALGGSDEPGNLVAINDDCHRRKTQREALQARRKVR
ncbi:HNH endonuclease [Pseudomonas panipatensis]|uniref:HNH endonuclease n=1 Tax=Pseudomonas panipatensis TaxID=428992 RepID=UPI000B7E9612|nr:HNH endonuclease signature motif containing protein [Pseudomonas panipatensis]